jgi:hypothetical protein
MSWDVLAFSSKQKITSMEEVDPGLFVPADFEGILANHFAGLRCDSDWCEVKEEDYAFTFPMMGEPEAFITFHLYGEKALFELIRVSRIEGWQVFDTGLGEMIDLDKPERNGYENFQEYLRQVLKK